MNFLIFLDVERTMLDPPRLFLVVHTAPQFWCRHCSRKAFLNGLLPLKGTLDGHPYGSMLPLHTVGSFMEQGLTTGQESPLCVQCLCTSDKHNKRG